MQTGEVEEEELKMGRGVMPRLGDLVVLAKDLDAFGAKGMRDELGAPRCRSHRAHLALPMGHRRSSGRASCSITSWSHQQEYSTTGAHSHCRNLRHVPRTSADSILSTTIPVS
jgi:hypothetical protein